MTKKDYIKIADIIKAYKLILPDVHVKIITNDFADVLQEDNERFHRKAFINYINRT